MPAKLDNFSRSLADQLAQRSPRDSDAPTRAPVSRAASPSNDVPQSGRANRPDPVDDEFSRRLSAASKGAEKPGGDPAFQPVGEGGTATDPAELCAPVGSGERSVRQGECLSSLATDTGHVWQTIWDDPANGELRAAGRHPNVLLPEDRVHVPAPREKWEPGQTETRHRFRRRGEPAVLSLRLLVRDEPLANQPYTLNIDGCEPAAGYTDPDGKLQCRIPGDARRGRLIAGEERHEFVLDLGHMDPVDSLSGVQKRLLNLGYECRRTDGVWDRHCDATLRRFQRRRGLPETGRPDAATRVRLTEAHGS